MEIIIIVILFSSIFIGAIVKRYNRKKGENIPTGERTLKNKIKKFITEISTIMINVVYVFIAPFLMIFGLYDLLLGWASISFLLSPNWILVSQILGCILFIIGYIIYVLGRIELGGYYADLWGKAKIGDDAGLIKRGVFSRMRHPLYAASVIFHLGTILIFQTWLAFAFFIPMTIFTIEGAYKEEEWLIENYGEEYKEYMKKTWRFFPKLW